VHDFQNDIDAIAAIAAVPSILDVICRTTGMGFAAVARVTEDRWIACGVQDTIGFGLQPGGELKVETTICNEIRASGQAVIIDHVAENPAFAGHHTPALYGFQSYISMPIMLPDGAVFGTLCAIDPHPHKLNDAAIIGTFKLFAELIAFHLDAHNRLNASQEALASERQIAVLREQFIAVLGHDLRNPLASIDAGTRLLQRQALDERATMLLNGIRGSVLRMAGLVDNLMDFARGRLGGGFDLHRAPADVETALTPVVEELRAVHPDRTIEVAFAATGPIDCDAPRIGQMLSNLIGNALTHGAQDGIVRIDTRIRDGRFEIKVTNSGEPIPPDALANLFKPFFRAELRKSQQGLGLGLYIASEIARAHGGTLEAVSDDDETSFIFSMPAAVADQGTVAFKQPSAA